MPWTRTRGPLLRTGTNPRATEGGYRCTVILRRTSSYAARDCRASRTRWGTRGGRPLRHREEAGPGEEKRTVSRGLGRCQRRIVQLLEESPERRANRAKLEEMLVEVEGFDPSNLL